MSLLSNLVIYDNEIENKNYKNQMLLRFNAQHYSQNI